MVAVLSRRVVAVVAALALTISACGNDADPTDIGGAATTLPGGGDVNNPPTPDGGGGKDGTRTTTRKPGSGGLPGGGNGGARPADADEADLRAAAKAAPGLFAGMLLAPSPADALVIDVLVQEGVGADNAAIAAIRDFLASASGKQVSVRGPVPIPPSGNVHTADAIRAMADANGRAQGGDVGVIHVLYLAGSFTDDGALGVAVRGDTVAIFPDEVDGASSPLVSRSRIERAVVTHELGHVLGLVDLYLNTGREDREHPGHSTNSRSVMFWAVESDLVGQVLGGPPPVDFDAADLADLRKIRDGAPAAR